MTSLTSVVDDLGQLAGLGPEVIRRLLLTAAVIVAFALGRWLMARTVRRLSQDVATQYKWRRGLNYGLTGLALLIIARVWFPGVDSLATFAGLIGAGVAVAMHDTIANFTGWLFILWRRPFQVGDRIEVDGTAGDVIDIRLFQFLLLEIGNWVDADQSTGRIVYVPNGLVLRHRVANYTKGFEYIWNEIGVSITFESNWRKAKRLLEEIITEHDVSAEAQEQVRKASDNYLIYFKNLTPIVYTAVKETGVRLTMRFLTPPRQRRGIEQRVWEAVLDAFAREDDIIFAYPTTRFFDNRLEGKPGTGRVPDASARVGQKKAGVAGEPVP